MSFPISEQPLHPSARQLSFYLVFILCVFPVWSIPIFSWLFVLYELKGGGLWNLSWHGKALFTYALAEVLFSIYHYNLRTFVDGPCPIPPGNLEELILAFKRITQTGLADLPEDGNDEETLDVSRPGSPAVTIERLSPTDPRAVDFQNQFRNWFGGVPWSQIRRKEMCTWLYWSLFYAHMPDFDKIPPARLKVLLDCLDMVEKRTGTTIPDGSNPRAHPRLLTLDPVGIWWRPLIYYLLVALSDFLIKQLLIRVGGMTLGTRHGLDYLVRVPPMWNACKDPTPIVFAYGLGLGLLQYSTIICSFLTHLPDRPLFVLLQPHISQQIFHPRFLAPKNRKETTAIMRQLLIDFGWVPNPADVRKGETDDPKPRGITLASHSNGSYVHAWFLKDAPDLVSRSLFIDPVTFCGWEGDLCLKFLYNRATTGLQLIMNYFVSTEMGIANLLQRQFDWTANTLFFEEIPHSRNPSRNKFIMANDDVVLCAQRIKRYLVSHGVRKGLYYNSEGQHGLALVPGTEGFNEIMAWLKESEQY
ncbi:hypothetical protein B0F90DRAFT_1622813 [Multifurca ochricompacta]|uniref:Uncharacterized protein n=1 Tax=Multifurca ochricompacta TaxID=376703 RepID=A0AAD4MBS8_9AGAM|nr:hypothetical protein B0F90DRAFT_1622813 [Multifurca ochricompacta]